MQGQGVERRHESGRGLSLGVAMKAIAILRVAAVAILGIVLTGPALAQTAAQAEIREKCEREVGYRPKSGQKGKDAIWVPT